MITLESINKRFEQIEAVKNLSLNISSGEVFGLLGPNGAGKSTSIAIMCGLIKPDSGKVELESLAPNSIKARQKIGLIPQSIALYEELTALDNLNFFADLYSMDDKAKSSRIDWCLEFVGLQDRAKDAVKDFSGGMKRRLNLAASLLHDPDYIFMDEPTAGVDPQSRNKLFDSVLALKNIGKTIVYTTHYMEEAEKLCDRVAIIDQGKLMALDTVDALVDQFGGQSQLRVQTDQGEQSFESSEPAKDIIKILQQASEVEDIKLRRPDLERVFLNLTGRQLRD
ncbi:ABC transporter ATP-binding protein [Kangiella sp. TOML190]|uniref:ABC transporter ATP-binding protein n=1 Tax=Kangiella sp. TOML190 TaxID=2931351 RepID=UPI002041EFEB|nr:ABC transporter ATP-binding protein [Kangiella sp. TOML190]